MWMGLYPQINQRAASAGSWKPAVTAPLNVLTMVYISPQTPPNPQHKHTHIHACMHTHIYVCAHTHTHTCTHAHTCMHTHTHHINTHTHTHTHTHTNQKQTNAHNTSTHTHTHTPQINTHTRSCSTWRVGFREYCGGCPFQMYILKHCHHVHVPPQGHVSPAPKIKWKLIYSTVHCFA